MSLDDGFNIASNNTTSSYLPHNTTSHVTSHSNYVFLLAPLMFGAFFGNALVILAFRKGPRKLRTLTNYFVVNLAVSDMLIGCVSLPIWIAINLEIPDATKEKIGHYHTSIDILLSVTSIYTLVVISLERLYAVKYPTPHRYLKQKTVMTAIAAIWGLAVFLTAVVSAITIYNPDYNTHSGWITPLAIVTYALPLTIITASYVILFTTASQLMKADNQPTSSVTREIRIAKTIFVIVSLFVVCWTPFIVVNLLYSYEIITKYTQFFKEIVQITKALHYTNSIMNVLVYAVRSPDFKETFMKILTSGVRQVRERAYTAMSMKDRNDSMTRAQMGGLGRLKQGSLLKTESLTGSVTVMLHLDDNDMDFNDNTRDFNENTRFGIVSRSGTYCTQSSRLSDDAFVTTTASDHGHDDGGIGGDETVELV